MKMPRRKTGTLEWAEINKNISKGCDHNCKYCYARSNAIRFKQIQDKEDWKNKKIIPKRLEEKPRKVKGRIMFPTTHDILPSCINETITYLRGWLEVGNDILIVSKPHFECIKRICDELKEYKKQIVFRFTIGSMNNNTLKFWEPGAPDFEERLKSLEYAYNKGFTTSVSCEPYLDEHIAGMVLRLYPYISDTIWIGKMNRINQRVDTDDWSKDDFKYLDKVKNAQTDEFIHKLYRKFKNFEKVKWKDSIKQVMGLPEEAIG